MFAISSKASLIGVSALVLAVAVLAAAFAFQHIGGLQPCVLCVYQRWPWVAVAGLGALLLLAGGSGAVRTLALAGLALSLAIGAGLGAFHVGVEQHWWAGTSECGGAAGAAQSVEALKQQLLNTPVVRCNEVAWSLGGISMAGFNALISAGALVVLVASLTGFRKGEV